MSAGWRYALGDVPGFYFDRRSGRYVEATSGRFVSRQRILSLLETRITHHQEGLMQLTQALLDGRLGLADWQRLFKQELKVMHIQQAVLARGGWANMRPADWGRVGAAVKAQYKYLNGFAEDIAAGAFKSGRPMMEGHILARAGMYAQSGRATYWKEHGAIQKEAGMTEERRIAVGDAGTCGPCSELAGKGWQPIGTLPPPGGPPCDGLTHCRCEKEFR